MRIHKLLPLLLTAALAVTAGPAAQTHQETLPQINAPEPLGPKPPVGSGGCSVTAPTCADVAPQIIRSALGPSPLERDIHFLTGTIGGRGSGSARVEPPLHWAVEAFRKAGADEAQIETDALPIQDRSGALNRAGDLFHGANVVAEIRGREKPDEFVILGAHLAAPDSGTGPLDDACNAALVIDAARAIHAAGTRPLRSIRFVLFTGEGQGMTGSWAYVRAHRTELDRTDAAIIYDAGSGPVTGYDLDGRRSLEAPLRRALEPAAQFGVGRDTYLPKPGSMNLDFLLEGVPVIVASRHARADAAGSDDLSALKRSVALAALTAYGIADLPERLGTRQTRPQIEHLLERTGLEKHMKSSGIWSRWERGERGRRRQAP